MAKILWIMNKYVTCKGTERYYPFFLKKVQQELKKKGYELFYIFFTDLFDNDDLIDNKIKYNKDKYSILSKNELTNEAERIERDYGFTFKQAYFPDIVQTSPDQNMRKISVPEKEFNNIENLISKFLFLENIILMQGFDIIFSDVSPEVEMEFGRAIGYRYNKLVLKLNEGSALGRTVFLQLFDFGKDRLVEAIYNKDFTYNDAKLFCDDFIRNKRLPYIYPPVNSDHKTLTKSILNKFTNIDPRLYIIRFFYLLIKFIKNNIFKFYLWMEEIIIKPLIEDSYEPDLPYLFMGFHLNQESTMVLRSLPYVNQTALIEMISRVLPYKYYLYVREHPHWTKTFPANYLAKVKKFPNVRLISNKISIHQIIRNSKGILTYNATTAIEALIYGKPVLSFASNIYFKHHPGVDYCEDLFELGKKLSELVNRKITDSDTYNYILKLNQVSNEFLFGSNYFLSEIQAYEIAIKFVTHFDLAINWTLNN